MFGYEEIKQMKIDLCKQGNKVRLKNTPDGLLVGAPANDPFYAGRPSNRDQAEWFVKIWEKFGSEIGVHLRGLHYKFLSQKNPVTYTGRPYRNIELDFKKIVTGAGYARHLGLIPEDAIIDRRNPDPIIKVYDPKVRDPEWQSEQNWQPGEAEYSSTRLPFIHTDLTSSWNFELWTPGYNITGYKYDKYLQPYHLEVWIEKSTMNDLLIPLCDEYMVNLVTAVGEMSIARVIELLKRIYERGKPARIFYISDFDPKGHDMPFSVARKIEYYLYNPQFWNPDYVERKLDVKLDPIILTKEQVDKYDLPRMPITEKELSKGNFEKLLGEGATELDALEALYPGEFAKIVENKILEFTDTGLEGKIREARKELDDDLEEEFNINIEPFQDKLDKIENEAKKICKGYEKKLVNLSGSLKAELKPLSEHLESIYLAIQEKIKAICVDIPELPEGEIEENSDNYLFDSGRDYLHQLEIYKRAKGK